MPRIFELRSCLQEVQDSILGDVSADDLESVSSAGRQISNPKDLWFDVRQPYLGSEQDVINIPDHMDEDDQKDSSDAIIEENNKENFPEAFPNIWRPATTITAHFDTSNSYDEIEDDENILLQKDQENLDPDHDSLQPPKSSKKKTQFPSKSKSESFRNNRKTCWPSRKNSEKYFWNLKNQERRHGNNDKKHRPGLGQVLSPKALYPSGPPRNFNVQDQKSVGNGNNNKIVQAASGGSSSSSMSAPVSNSSSGGGSNSSSSRMNAKRTGGSLNNNGELDLENLEYPDSPTSHKWFADNADLSPLTVLDNMNLKTEFPYSAGTTDVDKPPDINSITLDSGAENLFQFAASVPNVPDNTTTFLDIGTDTFSQSLYDDLINMNDFPNVGAFATATTTDPTVEITNSTLTSMSSSTLTTAGNGNNANHTTMTTVTLPQTSATVTTTASGQLVLSKPITLEKLDLEANPLVSVNLEDLVRLKGQQVQQQQQPVVATRTTLPLEFGNLLPIINVVTSGANTTNCSNGTIQITTNDQGTSVLKGLVEPLPASALKGLIKIEPTQNSTYTPGFIKVEPTSDLPMGQIQIMDHDQLNCTHLDQVNNPVFSPLSMGSSSLASPGSPNSTSPGLLPNGGGKMKSAPPSRKKSTASSNGVEDEEDISNIASLQTRIQIISQRLGIPPDAPIELINGGHGIKNPLSNDPTEGAPVKTEKLPPARPESDPTKFQCRLCSKIFTLQRLLNRHMKCHSDSKRYLCTFCGKGFNDTFDLKRHTRTHTGVRPYKCNLCEKSFTQRCSLESHCLKVHGVAHQYDYKQRRSKMYVCEDCGHTTPEPEVHYLHLKDNHPFSPALHKFYDKRHFKFTNANFANMLLQVNS